MTFGIDSSPTSSSVNSDVIETWAYTCPPGSNLLLVPCGYGAGSPGIVDSVTYNGLPLSLVGEQSGAGWATSQIWKLNNPPTGASYDVVISLSSTQQISGCAVALTDADLTLGTPVGTTSNTPNPSQNVSTTAGDIVVGMHFSDGGGLSTLSVTSPGVQLFVVNNLAVDSNTGAQYVTATGSSTTIAWTESDTGGDWALLAVAVKAAPVTTLPRAKNPKRRKRGQATTFDYSAKGWFSASLESAGAFDRDIIVVSSGAPAFKPRRMMMGVG